MGCRPWGREESDTTEQFTFPFHFHALEKEMATHSSFLAWRIPWTEKPGGLQPMGLQVGRNLVTKPPPPPLPYLWPFFAKRMTTVRKKKCNTKAVVGIISKIL